MGLRSQAHSLLDKATQYSKKRADICPLLAFKPLILSTENRQYRFLNYATNQFSVLSTELYYQFIENLVENPLFIFCEMPAQQAFHKK